MMKAALPSLAVVLLLAACGSVPVWEDETPVVVEAFVTAYQPDTMHMDFADGRYSTTHLFRSDLEIISPVPQFKSRLHIWSLHELDGSSPLARVGSRVTFTVPRKYLVESLSDPMKKHDHPFLYTESVTGLKEIPEMPNQVPEPTAANGRGSS